MGGLIEGDLGESYQFDGRPVADILKESIPVTLTMGFLALVLAVGVGFPAGIYAASRHDRAADSALRGFAMVGVSLPSFLLAPILILVFSSGWPLNWLWPSGLAYMLSSGWLLPSALWLGPTYWIFPVLTLAVRPAAFILRLTRASFLDKVSSDFVRTARGKGLGMLSIFYRHLLKNSIGPVLAYGGPLIAGLFSGSFVVEIIFAVPGVAKYFVQSIFYRDYPLIMGLTLFFSCCLLIGNLISDCLLKIIDSQAEVG